MGWPVARDLQIEYSYFASAENSLTATAALLLLSPEWRREGDKERERESELLWLKKLHLKLFRRHGRFRPFTNMAKKLFFENIYIYFYEAVIVS